VFGFLFPPRIEVSVSSAGLSFLISYIKYKACDYLGGALSDSCTVNANFSCSGSPQAITQPYKRSPSAADLQGTLSCVNAMWNGTEIGVLSNTFPNPSFSQSVAVSPGSVGAANCEIFDGGFQYVGLSSSSTTGSPTVNVTNLNFVF
jgi:hypothetical protein